MTSKELCKPWEHQISRRQLLGSMAASGAGALGAGALGGLLEPAVAEEWKKGEKQMIFIWLQFFTGGHIAAATLLIAKKLFGFN